MESIYNYSDYRQYIKDYYETHKAISPSFSFRYLSQKAGINSSAFFKFIIEGKRNLTKKTILKTCSALKLKDKDAEYFENLVFFNQARTIKEKNHYFDKLIEKQRARNVKILGKDQYDYFSAWYHCIIRELVTMYDFKENYGILGRMLNPPITEKQARDSVKLLLKLGFLKKVNDQYEQTEPLVSTGPGIRAHQIVQHQIEMLRRAIDSYDNCIPENRLGSSTTFSISRQTFKTFVKRIRELRAQLMEMARNDNNPELVYQLNINLFSLSKEIAERRKNG